jgi:hypothetical protein
MMKKVMFVVVALLVATTCFAQLQSGPSNTVGYVKIIATGDPAPGVQTVSTPFGLAFRFWDVPVGGIPSYGVNSTNPSDICGDQLNCGTALTADRILRQDNGNNAIRNSASGCAWTGTLETGSGMGPGRAYFYQNRTDANRNFVTAGEVDNTGNYLTVLITNNAFVPYSWRDSRSVATGSPGGAAGAGDLNLLASGFTGGTSLTSDRVVAQTGGATCYFRVSDNTWQGTLTAVQPGQAYFIHNRNHANLAWNYTYDASGAGLAISPDDTRRDDSGGTISKVPSSPKTKAGSSTTRE